MGTSGVPTPPNLWSQLALVHHDLTSSVLVNNELVHLDLVNHAHIELA